MSSLPLFVLYQVSNHKSDNGCFNAFQMPRNGAGVTLAAVKRYCKALKALNSEGVEGFHWRVRLDDKATNSRDPSFSWWDIQDENARLPTKDNVTLSQLEEMFMPSSSSSSSSFASFHKSSTIKASGAMRTLGKAMNAVTQSVDAHQNQREDINAPRVSVIAFKLLDLSLVQKPSPTHVKKINKRVSKPPAPSHSNQTNHRRPPQTQTRTNPHVQTNPQPAPHRVRPVSKPVPSIPAPGPGPRRPQQVHQHTPMPQQVPQRQRQSEPSLMDFVSSGPSTSTNIKVPTQAQTETPITRAQKLKREYEEKKRTQNRVWDDVDQRWVEVQPNSTAATKSTISEPPKPPPPTQKIKGISIDASNAIGKSAKVQAAVHNRVQELENAKQKAISELKEREAKVAAESQAEDQVRLRLEPKIKAWSEEHGNKKQLRALLSSLHMILWKECNWKQVSLGDILDDKKARRCYLKATLKVHPDKTRDLDAEKRFIAKRVFDALSQAMTEFENQK